MEKLMNRSVLLFITLSILGALPVFGAVAPTYDGKKQALDRVIASQDLQQLNQFIEEYKGTGWVSNATWYRDKLAADNAKKDGSVGALTAFLDQYPNSSWFNHVVYFRDKSAYLQTKLLNTVLAYDGFLEKYPSSEWQEQVIKRRAKLLNPIEKKKPKTNSATVNKKAKNEPAEVRRNREALAVYQTMADQREQIKQEKQKVKDRQQARLRNCHKMKDSIRRYDERIRWYKLDQQGKRQYLLEDEVKAAKQTLITKYEKRCS